LLRNVLLERTGIRRIEQGWRRVSCDLRTENIVWIFGAGRTGSSWLSRMMGEMEGSAVWFEPWVGALFDPNHLALERREGKAFILAPRYRDTWLGSIRTFVLDGVRVRFPELGKNDYLVVKEPGGSAGAPLLMEAFSESRMVLLVRDPRDVVASWMDAQSKGGWRNEQGKERRRPPSEFVKGRAKKYLKNVKGAKRAYDSHQGRKVLVRYEELRADTLATMKRIYSALEIPVGERELARAIEKHAWESIPEQEKGEGKVYRKATPGEWREDLSPEQAKMVECITAPLLKELYPEKNEKSDNY
jgi:sulfotransferase family protein